MQRAERNNQARKQREEKNSYNQAIIKRQLELNLKKNKERLAEKMKALKQQKEREARVSEARR